MTIKEIKNQLLITTVLNHYNLHPNKNQMLCCPFHQDQKASMKIYLETNTAYCFAGSCKIESLDTIDFIMQMEKGTKREALVKAKSLINHLPIKSKTMTTPINIDVELMTELFNYFEKGINLPQTKSAQAYKTSRGLNGKLAIGYNAGRFHQNKSKEIVERLLNAGLLKINGVGYQPWANRCLIFPLKNGAGEIVSLYGRSIKESNHFYLQNRKGLYPGYPKESTKRLVLTESVIDAGSLLQLDFMKDYEVLSLYGTNGLTTEHRQAILKCIHLEEIIFALDGDAAGRKSTKGYTRQLKELYPNLKFTTLNLPEGEDVNSLYANHLDKVGELFMNLFENREPVERFQLKEKATPVQNQAVANRLITDNEELLLYQAFEELLIQILGGLRLEGLDRMKVTLKLKYSGMDILKTYRDSLDLYSAQQVEKFIKRGSARLELSSKLLQQSVDDLTESLETYRLEKMENKKTGKAKLKILNPKEIRESERYLKAKDLLKRTNEDIGKSGVIGEENNRLVLFLIYLSRKMAKPLHALIFGKSGSGKTHLQSSVAELIPEEDKLETTTLSDNAVYYFGENEISHFLILIEDMDGAEGVLLALRELQSKREVRKTVTIKDEKGKMKTVTLIVRGPICLSGCTTKERIYEDNANRSFLLYVDGSAEQDERIMNYQRKESAGKINRLEQEQIKERFKNMQRLLKPLKVVNPFAEYIRIPKEVFKPRRTNSHVIQFIEVVTYYHQYQRAIKTDPRTSEKYIETTIEDVELAFKLLEPILLNKSDELGNGCRSFYELLKDQLKAGGKKTFYKREVRQWQRINPNTLKYYINELLKYGQVRQVGGSRYNGGYEYEVLSMEDYSELTEKVQGCLSGILLNIKKNNQN